jgi:hypothetical protein
MKIQHSLFFLIFFFLLNCSSNIDPITGEKTIIEPNIEKRAREAADKGGGIFANFGKPGSATTYDFATSNVLWRATLKTLDFLPIINADYSGGIIIYDWYSENLNSNEQIKISVRFLNNEVKSESIQVSVHKKICKEEKCSTVTLNNSLPKEIKESILASAKILKIEAEKSKK